jgi:hypothetical protein
MFQNSLRLLDANLQDVSELFSIPKLIPGHRYKILQINKTAIVFITASFEVFIESLAEESFNYLINQCDTPEDIPRKIRNLVASSFINSTDIKIPWSFAGDGWRDVLLKYNQDIVKKYVGPFNTPKPENIDSLFSDLIGLKNISSNWSFEPERFSEGAIKIYERYLNDRHVIVHRNDDPRAPSIFYARRYKDIVETISKQSANAIEMHFEKILT